MSQNQIAIIGLGTMGANLARNFASHNIKTAVYNRTAEVTQKFAGQFPDENIQSHYDLETLVQSLEAPRKIILLVQAGDPVDQVIAQLEPLMQEGDIVMDFGNSFYKDAIRRTKNLAEKKINFMGVGISGGEEGALKGPSLMPSGASEAVKTLLPLLQKIAAKDFSGNPCVTHIGTDGAGHFVKMVHNGIEYAVMQIITEGYDLLKSLYNLTNEQIAEIFTEINEGPLKSYLLETSIAVLRNPVFDKILDKAEQKGTGKWTAIESFDRGVPTPTISQAVYARVFSSLKSDRTASNKIFELTQTPSDTPLEQFKSTLENAMYFAIFVAYIEGFCLISQASDDEKWNIDLNEVSRIWQGGCIVRSEILRDFSVTNSMRHKEILKPLLPDIEQMVCKAANHGVSVPCMSASLMHLLSITRENSPANLIQGMRDFFGSHGFKMADQEGDFHL